MHSSLKKYSWVFILSIIFSSCEQEYTPSSNFYKKQIVVESYIEKSSEGKRVYAIVTYSLPFYSSFGLDIINKSFVRNADVSIYDGSKKIKLVEICKSFFSDTLNLPDSIKAQIYQTIGYSFDSIKTDVCFYLDINREIVPEVGKTYTISVIKDSDTLTAITDIPKLIPIDSLWFEKPAGKNKNDTFAQMFCIISDIPLEENYYRSFTAGKNEPFISNVNSVTDDVFFDGQKFKFTLAKALGPDEKFGDNSGLFRRGDSIKVQWCNIPKSHFDFWKTLETSRTRQGPFSSYVRIDGNIKNGLGIFGGQNCSYYSVYVPL